MTSPLSVECDVHFHRPKRNRKELRVGVEPTAAAPLGRIPRVAKYMALAVRLERLVRSGAVKDYAELARLGHVTRARVSQVMNLLQLVPDVQEAILFLPRTARGRDPIILRQLQPLASTLDWGQQRRMWAALRAK